MSTFLSDADLAVTELGRRARAVASVADATVASIFDEFAEARAAGRHDVMNLIRDRAYAFDPDLLAELDGFDYPAAA
jgi:hypothetical protein